MEPLPVNKRTTDNSVAPQGKLTRFMSSHPGSIPPCPATPAMLRVGDDVTANKEWALYPADIFSQIVAHLDYRSAIAFALSCKAIASGTKIWWAMCNDNGKRQIETSQNASQQFHQSKLLRQDRFLLITIEGIRLARAQGVNCGPNMRKKIVDGLCTRADVKERAQNTSSIWLKMKKEFEQSDDYTDDVVTNQWASRAYQSLCAIFDELSGGTAQPLNNCQHLTPRLKSLLVKYIIDEALSIRHCLDALIISDSVGGSDELSCLYHLEDHIDLGEFDVNDVITNPALRNILNIPAIVSLLHEGAISPKELCFALITNKKEFFFDNTMLEKFSYIKFCFKNFSLAAIKDIKWELSYEFTFADILQCELIQNGLKRRHATLTQLVNLPDDVIYHLMFNGYLRDALKEGKLTLTDVVAQNDKYIKYRDERHFYDRLRLH